MNAALFQLMFWDGRATTLEEQARLPILNPIEMGHPDGAAAVKALEADPAYVGLFQKAYGRGPNYEDVGRAIATFERTLIFLDAPFDKYVAGDSNAISPAAQRGLVLFGGKARCVSCHMLNASNPIGTDNLFHNIGVSARTQNFEELAKKGLAAIKNGADERSLDKLALETDLSELGRFITTRNRRTSARSRPSNCATWALPPLTCTTARCTPCGTWWTTTTKVGKPTPISTVASSRWT